MVTKELSKYNSMMLLDKINIALIELFPEPWLMSLLFKKARRHVTDKINLEERTMEVH